MQTRNPPFRRGSSEFCKYLQATSAMDGAKSAINMLVSNLRVSSLSEQEKKNEKDDSRLLIELLNKSPFSSIGDSGELILLKS